MGTSAAIEMPEVVYRRRGLSWLYYLFTVTFVAFGLMFLVVSFGNAVDDEPWSAKRWSVVGYAVGGLSWLMGAPQMWSLARTYGRNVVRLDSTGYSLHATSGEVIRFAFADVEKVSWNPGLQARLCTVKTPKGFVFFDARSCPRPGHVAKLIAERAGKTLRIETA